MFSYYMTASKNSTCGLCSYKIRVDLFWSPYTGDLVHFGSMLAAHDILETPY